MVTAKLFQTKELGPAGVPGLLLFCSLVLFYRIDNNQKSLLSNLYLIDGVGVAGLLVGLGA